MWPFKRRGCKPAGNGNGAAAAKAAAESTARKRAAEMAPVYLWAEHLASLPPDDLVERVARMFGRHA